MARVKGRTLDETICLFKTAFEALVNETGRLPRHEDIAARMESISDWSFTIGAVTHSLKKLKVSSLAEYALTSGYWTSMVVGDHLVVHTPQGIRKVKLTPGQIVELSH